MANTIKGAILMRDEAYFGGSTQLKKVGFNKEQIVDYAHGWVYPYVDNGLGSPTFATSFVEQIAAPPNGKRATQIRVAAQNNEIHDWSLSCNSQDFDAALTSADPQFFTDLSVATGSGYTTVG